MPDKLDKLDEPNKPTSDADSEPDVSPEKVTPLRCLLASGLSGAIAYCSYLMFNSIVQTYAAKAVTSANPIVINLTSAVRTMVMGIVALGAGVFGVVALGLLLLGIQVTFKGYQEI